MNTSKVWVNYIVTTVFLMIMYLCAEREGNWALHLCAVSEAFTYFFYLNEMRKLPPSIDKKFLRGEQTTIYQRGIWDDIWSDLLIESTLMKYGQGTGRLFDITLQKASVKKWAYSLHVSTQLLHELDKMREEKQRKLTVHKKGRPSRIKADGIGCK